MWHVQPAEWRNPPSQTLAPIPGGPGQSTGMTSLERLIGYVLALVPLSVAGMAYGGREHRLSVVILSATLFCSCLIGLAIATNAKFVAANSNDPHDDDNALPFLRHNTRLLAVAYAWGGFAMQVLYTTPLTTLKWQHGWQYAAIMALMAAGALLYARLLEQERPKLRRKLLAAAVPLAIGHALLAAGGLVYLAASGKLLLRGSDWAANQVFLFGALTVMILAAVTLRTHARLTRDHA